MTIREQLCGLAEKARVLPGPDRKLDAEIAKLIGLPHGYCERVDGRSIYSIDECSSHFTASIDAALTVVPKGWSLLLAWNGKFCVCDVHPKGQRPAQAVSKFPARALLSAALMARAEDEGQ